MIVSEAERLERLVSDLLDLARLDAREFTLERRLVDVGVVADDGPGISEEDRPHLFERLYVARHTPQPKEAGSGLGLAIVAELTEAMGGTVSVAPRHPTGTQFTVELPAAEIPGEEPPPRKP